MYNTCICLLMLCLMSSTFTGESAILTIIPESLSITNNTGSSLSVTVKCSPGNNGYLNSLSINRNLTANPTNEIRMARAIRPDDNVQIITNIPGATVSGSLTEGFIMVTMTQVSCKDAGTYRCKANYIPQGAFDTEITVEDKNFTVQVLPGQITIIADPQNIYELNTTVTMTCNGHVGSTTNETQIRWVWEYQEYQNSTWNSYMTDSDIAPPTSSLPDINCQITQVSVLTRKLTQEDSRRTYRCYIHRNGQSYVQFAGMYQIGTISSIAKSNDTQENPWKIAVIALVVVIFVACALAVVYKISGQSLSNFLMRLKPVMNNYKGSEPVVHYNNATPEDGPQIYNEIAEKAEDTHDGLHMETGYNAISRPSTDYEETLQVEDGYNTVSNELASSSMYAEFASDHLSGCNIWGNLNFTGEAMLNVSSQLDSKPDTNVEKVCAEHLEPVHFVNTTPDSCYHVSEYLHPVFVFSEALDEETNGDPPFALPPDYLHPVFVFSAALDAKMNEDQP